MSQQIRTGTQVRWSWGNGTATGKVTGLHHASFTRTIKGGESITRNGTDDDPRSRSSRRTAAGVLKLRSEVERATS